MSSINGPIGQDLIIDVDTNRVIKFKDNVVMDSSLNVKTINGLSLINGPATGDLIIDAGNPSQIVQEVRLATSWHLLLRPLPSCHPT